MPGLLNLEPSYYVFFAPSSGFCSGSNAGISCPGSEFSFLLREGTALVGDVNITWARCAWLMGESRGGVGRRAMGRLHESQGKTRCTHFTGAFERRVAALGLPDTL